MSWREIAEVCYIRYARRPDHKSVKHIATSSPPSSLQTSRYQPWHQIPDPAERKLAVIRLHSEGWSIASIAAYMQTTRPTIYATLQRWAEEGVAGLEEKSQTHQVWWANYNTEHHYAHRERQDGRRSPAEVLRGMLGRTYPPEVLSRVLHATQFTRHLDRHGYIRFNNWRIFGEDGLAGEPVSVWIYEGTLKIEYQTMALSLYEF